MKNEIEFHFHSYFIMLNLISILIKMLIDLAKHEQRIIINMYFKLSLG